MAKWARPLVECSVGADLPRLGNKHEVRGEDGSVVLHPSMDENAKPFETVSELFRVLHGSVIAMPKYGSHFIGSLGEQRNMTCSSPSTFVHLSMTLNRQLILHKLQMNIVTNWVKIILSVNY